MLSIKIKKADIFIYNHKKMCVGIIQEVQEITITGNWLYIRRNGELLLTIEKKYLKGEIPKELIHEQL